MPRNCEERIKKDPPIMHVIERVLDRFQEWCSGCVGRSIGPIVGQIKSDPPSFLGVLKKTSDFAGLDHLIFHAGTETDTGLLPAGSRCVPNLFKDVSEFSQSNGTASELTNW